MAGATEISMCRRSWRAVPALALACLAPGLAMANPEYSRRSGKECNYCHPANTFRMNEAGRYYKEHKSLKGFVPPADADWQKKIVPPLKPQGGSSGKGS